MGKQHLLRGLDISLLPIFNDIPADLLERITPEMLRFYGDGTIILAEGAPADNLLILLRGQVRILLNGTFLVTRYPYAVLGEQAFYITGMVFNSMSKDVKYGGENNSLMWDEKVWTARNNMRNYGSTWWWSIA